jgi:hypothetical protein
VTAAVVCGALVAALAHFTLLHNARSDAARLSRVNATVIEPAVPHLSRPAIGSWTAADGTRHSGIIPAPPERPAGSGHPVWIDKIGQISAPPQSPLHRSIEVAVAGTSVTTAVLTLIIARSRVRRDRALDAEWQKIAREWTRRYL